MPMYAKAKAGPPDPTQQVVDLVTVPGSTSTMTGTAPTVANAAAAPTQAEYNNLLAALRTRGVIA
ncbi:hypothetical protein [Streptomyces sp. LS1784]|uniref:hypothetical protein n=1 Tax=Streptomyces sp. LS1784 TaxID=2851533 RepID=UPI001CC9A269|nr:hypothetical protein [Streptomyces sp. LS1784]